MKTAYALIVGLSPLVIILGATVALNRYVMKNDGSTFDRRCMVLAFLPLAFPITCLMATYLVYRNHFNIHLFGDLSDSSCFALPFSICASVLFLVDNSKKKNKISRRITYGYIMLLAILLAGYVLLAKKVTIG